MAKWSTTSRLAVGLVVCCLSAILALALEASGEPANAARHDGPVSVHSHSAPVATGSTGAPIMVLKSGDGSSGPGGVFPWPRTPSGNPVPGPFQFPVIN